MPFYEYQCLKCWHEEEVLQKVSDKPLTKCPECGKSSMKKMDIKFDIANDGLEAISMFNKAQMNQYSIILMDENMPNMNGIVATQEIRNIEKEKSLVHTPIIAITANALEADVEKCFKAGVDDVIAAAPGAVTYLLGTWLGSLGFHNASEKLFRRGAIGVLLCLALINLVL